MEEHSLSESQAFTTGENWSTAYAVDSSHAANLSFSYKIKNTGTEYARELSGIIFNVYLGNDTNPIVSYPVGQTFTNVFPYPTTDIPPLTSSAIPLTLDQMRRIDLGEHLTVVLANFSYGVDQLFYQNAVQGGVTIFTEGGADDAGGTVDSYVVPTWGTESVQDVLARYFPTATDADGLVNSLSTPTFSNNIPTWHEHFLSDIAWWNVFLSQSDAGNTQLRDLPSQPNTALFFRFNRDSDRDGYPDRAELQYGTDPHDPASHPTPELLAGYTASRTGNLVTVKLALDNSGTFDAYHVSAVMYSPDDTTTIGNNTIGGNGRVRPGHHVAVGSLVKAPGLANWGSSTARPYSTGDYGGGSDTTYLFSVTTPGTVGQGSAAVGWSDGIGGSGTLDLGSSYHAPLPLPVSQGVVVGFDTGTIYSGASFTVTALTPRDTFTYTVNTDPYTKPVIIVSYSDPQGAHRFLTPVQVPSLGASLVPTYTGQMLKNVGLSIATTGAVVTTGLNTTDFILNSPDAASIQGAHLYVDFVSNGALVLHQPYTFTLDAGPTVYAASWSTSAFSQTFSASADNILIAHWTDSEGNIIDSAARPLNTFAADPIPAFAMANADLAWNFGTVTQGQVLTKRLTFANTGFTDLQTYLSDRIAGPPKQPWVAFTNGNYVRKTALQGNYLWEATSGGVVVRDLTNGTYAKFTTADTRLADNDIYSVFIDAGGRKWFGTYSGVSVLNDNGTPLDKSDDTWITFTTADGLAGNPVFQIVVDNAGRKWLVSDYGVNVFDDGGTPFNKTDDLWQTFTRTDVGCVSSAGRAIAIDNAGLKWIGCGWDGLSVLDDKGTPFNKSDDQWQHFNNADGMGSTLISSIAIDSAGRKWLASWSSPGGAMVLNDNGTPFNKADDQWQYFSSADSGLVNNGVQSVVIDGAGYKWFGTNGGVSVLNDNGTPFNKADDSWITFTTTDGLAASRANHVLIDGSGRKWIATEGGGVSRLNDNATPFNKSDDQWQTYTTADGLAANRISAIVVDAGGLKWIGTILGGVSLLDDKGTLSNMADDQWQTFTGADGLPADIIYAIAIDGAGRKWFAGHNYQVSVLNDNGTPFNKLDDQWQTFTTADGLGGITFRIVIDGAGRKWFATWGGVSVLNDNGTPFNKADDQWITFSTADGLANNFVGALVIDGAGRKWIGTDGGVSLLNDNGTPFNKADDQWVTFTTADGLVNNVVGSIAIDPAGRKWFGTGIYSHNSGGGVSVLDDKGTPFNKADDQWQSFTTADGLAGNTVFNIFIDNLGRKWFETDGGISVLDDNGTPFNKADDHWTTYTAMDGLTNNSVNVLILDGTGNKWFGTEGGVSVLPAGSAPSSSSTLNTLASRLPPADTATYTMTVDASALPAGPYSRTVTIRASDPLRSLVTVLITGSVNSAAQQSLSNTPLSGPDVTLSVSDVLFGASNPTEGASVPVTATLHNIGGSDTGGMTAAFYATVPAVGPWYIGSAYVPNVPAGGTAQASILWNTLGFTGTTTVRIVADLFNRIAETNENNNQVTATLTILSRPDLLVTRITPSDPEPTANEVVTTSVVLRNNGQTPTPNFALTLYDGNPSSGGTLIGTRTLNIAAGVEVTSTIPWAPAHTGQHQLFAVADTGNSVNEYDETNNQTIAPIFVGLVSPILLDSGGPNDPPYTPALGYGYITAGSTPSSLCGSQAYQTARKGVTNTLQYRFDNLLPGHFYHLDLTLFECDGSGRSERVLVDGTQVAGAVDMSDAQPHRLSLRLDPAVYADHTIIATIEEMQGLDAILSEIRLYDVDYRYTDAGASNEQPYSVQRGYGYLDGARNAPYGELPVQTQRRDTGDNDVQYRFDGLRNAKQYVLNMTFYHQFGTAQIERVGIDNAYLGPTFTVPISTAYPLRVEVPPAAYASDGSIVVAITKTNALVGGFVNEIALEELTLPATPAVADLALAVTTAPPTALLGKPITYTAVITNNGPDTATNAQLLDTLPAGLSFTSSSGACSGSSVLTCNLGALPNGGTATVLIVATPSITGTLASTLSVASDATDLNTLNSSVTVSVTVTSAQNFRTYLPVIER